MTIESRTPSNPQSGKLETGLMTAKVVGYLDPSLMGGIEVTLLRNIGNTVGDIGQTYTLKYAPPFYGSTAYEHMGLNKADFNDTQKSYGMWFPTPEIGTTVICAFIDGEPSDGYWFACVPSRFGNQMVPAIGGSSEVELTPEDKKKYDTTQPLPVAEVNRKTNDLEKKLEMGKIKKAVHPIADRFLEQGLLEDDIRGVTTSTSRRSIPNSVFGISTPGPFDRGPNAKKQFIGKKQTQSASAVPVSRLGGTTLVFDDGDDQYVRKTPASSGPIKYADTLAKEKGDVNIPYNEYFRVRTRTGHQILLHNSEDIIYIGNARGTTWIEMTSNGKIDIFAQDSVSIHTENDLNFRADRDINLEAGRNINLKAVTGRLHADIATNLELVVGANGQITTTGNLDIKTTGNNKMSAGGTLDLKSGGATKITAGGDASIGAANLIFSGGKIDLNGPQAPAAEEATAAIELTTHKNIKTSSKSKWGDKKRYSNGTLDSIMRRIPMHEPWALHENNAPTVVNAENTDRDA